MAPRVGSVADDTQGLSLAPSDGRSVPGGRERTAVRRQVLCRGIAMMPRPIDLNRMVALLFSIGSALFVLGSVPAYLSAVGQAADSVTYFVGSIFFTSASFAQLVQVQSPAMTEVDADSQYRRASVRFRAWLPHDRNWLAAVAQFPGTIFFNISTFAALLHNVTAEQQDRRVWRPDFYGSTLFLVASLFAILALGRLFTFRPRSFPWWIAWVNMVGSILFMASAIASFVLHSSDQLISDPVSVGGTLLGALCFLLGAILMLPAWKRAVRAAEKPLKT
jgi:hypothetical protein